MILSTSDKLMFVLAAAVVLASAGDIISDLGHGAPLKHLLQELALMSLAAALLIWMFWDMRRQKRLLKNLKRELAQSGDPAKPVNPLIQSARERLSEAVDVQFRDWQLSPGERSACC